MGVGDIKLGLGERGLDGLRSEGVPGPYEGIPGGGLGLPA